MERCRALKTLVPAQRHKTLLRQRRRLIGRCACLLRSRAKMIASAPPVPISPISGHTGEAEWSRRDIPLAVSLGIALGGSSFGGAKK